MAGGYQLETSLAGQITGNGQTVGLDCRQLVRLDENQSQCVRGQVCAGKALQRVENLNRVAVARIEQAGAMLLCLKREGIAGGLGAVNLL